MRELLSSTATTIILTAIITSLVMTLTPEQFVSWLLDFKRWLSVETTRLGFWF